MNIRNVKLAFGPRLDNIALYRFFDSEQFADDFAEGRIWFSTLASCRAAEGSERGDPKEGAFVHSINRMNRSDNPTKFDAAMSQTGVFLGMQGDISLEDLTIIGGEPDSYVLCFTQRYAPKTMSAGFGKWCVKISRPLDFFRAITLAIAHVTEIDQAVIGPVEYLGREMTDYDAAKVPKFFLKPRDGYEHQQEIRMMWNRANIIWSPKPFLLPCPEIAPFCSLIEASRDG